MIVILSVIMKESNKIIIGIVGEMGSGKSTVSRYIAKKYHASSYRFSDMLRDILEKLCIPVTRDNLIDLFLILAPRFGEDVLAAPMKKKVDEDSNSCIVVEGIRRPADISHLEELPHFFLIGIQSDQQDRFNRVNNRHERIDDQKNYQEFIQDHQKQTEVFAPTMAKRAKYLITNNGSIEDLYNEVDKVMQKIIKEQEK